MTSTGTGAAPALSNKRGDTEPEASRSRLTRYMAMLRVSGMLPALVGVIVIGTYVSPAFLTAGNFETVLKLTSVVGLVAIGQTLVILSGAGGIDLSVGAVIAVSGVTGAIFSGYGMPGFILGCLAAGAYFGFINGLGVTRGLLQPFIVTLATMTIARGVAFYLSQGSPLIVNLPELDALGSGSVWLLPTPALVFILVAIVTHVYLRYTVGGRELYAIGGTEEAAYLSGVPVARRRMLVYVVSGLLAGCAAILLTSFTASADANAASGYELSAIAAVVVGGTALSGGQGGIIGTMIGVFIIALTGNILNLANVDPFMQLIVNGLIVLVAVSLEARGKSAGSREGRRRLMGLATMYAVIALGGLTVALYLAPTP